VEGQNIIIKKVKKGGHGGHHGGSWKVAYADFVTAMMAFFLLLWLTSMVAPEKRARVSHYFKHFSIFDKSGSTMLDLSKGEVKVTVVESEGIKDESKPPPPEEKSKEVTEEPREDASTRISSEEFMEKLRREVETKLADVKDQITVDVFEGGVRIEIVDKDGNPMFPSGSAEMSGDGRKILKVITENLKDNDSKIAIEGHTDARQTTSSRYSNWELSTERASAARKELERDGLNPDRLIRVAGYAATEPLVKKNPLDPRNRRISILLFYKYGPRELLPVEPSRQPLPSLGPAPDSRSGSTSRSTSDPGRRGFIKRPIDPVHNYLFNR
jgi:chemotaxis protein MotB